MNGVVEVLNHDYAGHFVKEEKSHRIFEFVNNNIGMKLKLTTTEKGIFCECEETTVIMDAVEKEEEKE
ncbi:hypothetical protein DdX_16115 [Ditylenchus destructor]|uniref:Uncharacterized protein n=1 Tax=Ditylenchus destructor TaxID=166010 RepID=A0AAD4MRL1_9BILA|nr:hypothetical protein DdX_16115 [Ditylenchus destructor]